jgi:succinate dehydrogenase / fumarate reductase flavoprotein subunit
MQDLVVIDGKARGIARDLVTGEIERHSAHAVVIASGGYGNVFFLSTYAMGSNATAWKIHKRSVLPILLHKIHPTSPPFQEITSLN